MNIWRKSQMKIETIILDWAGTTVDYGCMAPVNAFFEAFKHQGIQVSIKEIREPMGMLKKDHIRYLLKLPNVLTQWKDKYAKEPNESDVEAIYHVFEENIFKGLADYSKIKPNVVEVVKELRALGISIGSTTGYTREMMKVVRETARGQGYIPDCVVTPDDVSDYGRPYPYMIFSNMQQLKSTSVSCVVKVGDTLADIQEGKHAGVKTIGIISGSSLIGLTEEEEAQLPIEEKISLFQKVKKTYYEAGADYVIETIQDLPKVINKIEN